MPTPPAPSPSGSAPVRGRVAYFVPPHAGGVYTKYRYLRRACRARGWEVECWSVGADAAAVRDDVLAAAEDGEVRVAPAETDPRAVVEALVGELDRRSVDVVLPMLSRLCAAAVPHFPADVKVVNCCFDITPWAFGVATDNRDRAARITATTPRQRDGVLQRGVPPEQVELIPLAVVDDLDSSAAAPPRRSPHAGPLRLAFVGRVEDRQKGVMILPRILKRLRAGGVPATLAVAGEGPDVADLAAALRTAGVADQCELLGRVPPSEVAQLLADKDVFLFPSRHEGFGLSAVEAAAAGCVPVASRIPGVTDFTIRHGETGLLCDSGDPDAFAAAIASLHADRDRLAALANAGIADARDRFGLTRFGNAYADLFAAVTAEPDGPPPRPWAEFRPPPKNRGRLTRWIPRRWRRAIRGRIERLRGRRGG